MPDRAESALISTMIVPKHVTVQGDAARSASIKAAVGFPTSTPLVQMGAETTQYEHNMWLRNLTIDANHVAGSIGVVFLPHLRLANPPYDDPKSRGAFVGLDTLRVAATES